MSNELILAVVLTIVLVADLILRSLKKKDKIDDSPKIGEETSKKRRFNFNYFINRKRNIVTFIILGLVLKPAVHYQFFTEFENYINTDKKLPSNEKLHDFEKSCAINYDLVKIYGDLFSKAWLTKINEIKSESLEWWEKSPIKMDENNYKLYDEAGNQVIIEKEGEIVNFFIHPKESRKKDLQFHFDNIFKLKLWIFLISFSFMGLLVFLFNDKIQAR